MFLVVMMHGKLLTKATFMHRAVHSGHKMEFRPGKLLDRAAFIYHADKDHTALMHYAALKGLRLYGIYGLYQAPPQVTLIRQKFKHTVLYPRVPALSNRDRGFTTLCQNLLGSGLSI